MRELYPPLDPFDEGELDVGDANTVHWEVAGSPSGKPALVLHGGPGSGLSRHMRRLFDPQAYLIVQFDQRGCGRSTPHASDPRTALDVNTTWHLVADVERLRAHLGIDRWLVMGASWGSTLALAYATTHPERASEMVLYAITTGRHSEFDWIFRGTVAPFFPEQWERLVQALPPEDRDGDVVAAYRRLLADPDPEVRRRAAFEWCMWESATPDWPPSPTGLLDRFRDPDYALAFARLVTHYAHHYGFVEDGALLRGATGLRDVPAVLVHGRFDFQAPLENAWVLKRAWPTAELIVLDDAGHRTTPAYDAAVMAATDAFARRR
jgi:proline iminopeptidase